MFGYVVINKGEMKFKEFDVYQSYYCGLCRALKERYGVLGQISLTYDMTFLVMLLTSLYEPETAKGMTKCIAHPFEKHQTRRNEFSAYGADMNVLFSYYKCLDDWQDDKKILKLAYSKLMKKSYHKINGFYVDKVKKMDALMREFGQKEQENIDDIDKMAGLFGELMGEMFVVKQDEWEDNLRRLGTYLGKFIYLLDAYEDVEEDIKSGRFNPLKSRYENPDFEEEIKTILTMMMAGCCQEFEKLPIIDHIEILRNILYSGVWYRYEAVHEKRKVKGQESEHA
ncbi:MAG: hypothetical protein IJD96_09085 [Lachnospiraceae bacterium]|nr:hypothetical protein [Lachnospiraceae bacterium]